MSKIEVLLVDAEEELITTIAERLRIRGMDVRVSFDRFSAMRMIREREPEVMVTDISEKLRGLDLLRWAKQSYPGIQVIVTKYDGSRKEIEAAMRLSAFEYFEKPVDLDKLAIALRLAHEDRELNLGGIHGFND